MLAAGGLEGQWPYHCLIITCFLFSFSVPKGVMLLEGEQVQCLVLLLAMFLLTPTSLHITQVTILPPA